MIMTENWEIIPTLCLNRHYSCNDVAKNWNIQIPHISDRKLSGVRGLTKSSLDNDIREPPFSVSVSACFCV